MAIERIGTFAMYQSTLRDASKLMIGLFDTQTQISSGLKARDFASLDGQVEQFTALENKMRKTSDYVDNNKVAQARINATDSALQQIIDSTTNLKNLVLQRRNGAIAGGLAFQEQLEGYWKGITSQLNTNYEGRYLFSGTRTDGKAVNDETFPQSAVEGELDTGYYTGSSQDITIRVQDDFTTSYNVRADEEAFQKIYAALSLSKSADIQDSDEKLAQAYDLLSEGLSGVINVQAQLGATSKNISQSTEKLDSLQNYYKGLKDELINADVVSLSSTLAVNQGILQASFQAFAKINSLRLTDFLR